MKTYQRILALVLALLLILPTFMACAGNSDVTPIPTATPTETPDTTTAPAEEAEKSIYDVTGNLPELNFDDREFVIYYLQDKYVNNFYVDERSGDLVDDAVFDSISNTEEKLNVEITALHTVSGDEYSFHDSISSQIASGLPEFNLTRVHDVLGANLSIQGYFLNLYDLNYLSLEEEWWIPQSVQSLTFKNQLYLVSTAMSYHCLSSTNVVFFNKTMMTDRGIEYPYAKVSNMEWYLEDMLSQIEDVYIDENTDGIKDEGDTYGLILQTALYAFYESFGIFLAEKDEDNQEIILNGHDERAYTLLEMFYNAVYENDGGLLWNRDDADSTPGANTLFAQGQAIYVMNSLGLAVDKLRATDVEYGIVPFPMLDEEQEQYYSGYTDRYFAVPNTCDDYDFTGAVMESMSIEGYRNITPAYFETALKERYSKDAESKEMMDLIRRVMVLDFAYVYGNDCWWSRGLHDLLVKQSKDYASFYEAALSKAEGRVTTVTEAFEKLEE